MKTSRDYKKLARVWSGWRNATGRRMKDDYAAFVNLSAFTFQGNGG